MTASENPENASSPSESNAADNDVDSHEARLAMLFSDLMDRVQKGEAVDLGATCAKHPEFQEELRQLWGTIMVTHTVGKDQSHSGENEESTFAPPIAPPLELPSRFGAYTLIEEIGRGGMGVVYLARHEETGNEFALKMILHGDQASETTLRRFHAEAKAGKGMDHPNIIKILDVGQQDGRAFFCMELIHGETLSERLDRGPMPPRQTARILMQVARAIDYAHSQGVLHRDLKPSNILISDENNKPYVVDFGLARDVTANESLTRTGSVIGTPSYMAPNKRQALGARWGPPVTSTVWA